MAKTAEKEFEDNENTHQMVPLLSPTYADTLGLDCLRMIDTLIIKQEPSLCESKLFEKIK
jgi:hypothetical protein